MTDVESDVVVLDPDVFSWFGTPSGVIPLILWLPPPSVVVVLLPSDSFFSSLSPALASAGSGETEVQELGLPVLGVNGWQVALGTRKPVLSPLRLLLESFLSDDLEYGLKLDLSSAPMSLIFSGPDLVSLSLDPFDVTEDSLDEDGGSGFPI